MTVILAIDYNLNYQKKQTSDEFKNNQMTYTYCRQELLHYYLLLGFEEMSVEEIESNKDLSNFGERFQLSEWKDDSLEDRLKIVKKRGVCPRVLNVVNVYQDINIEESMYCQNSLDS